MGTNVTKIQEVAKNSSEILTSESNEMDLSKELPTSKGENGTVVDARILHKFLVIGKDFSNWIKDRISRYDFIENQDYVVIKYDYLGNVLNNSLNKKGESDIQHVSKIDYALTLDAAKEICMIENNERGKMARRYFISIEKRYRSSVNLLDFEDPAAAAEAWAKEYRARVAAEKLAIAETARAEQEKLEKETALHTLESKQEDLDFAESFIEPGENDMLVRVVAKKLEQNNIIIAEKALRKFLQETGFFCKNDKNGQYELRADIIKKGYAFYRSFFIDSYDGERVNKQIIYITGLGYKAITKAIKTKCKSIFLKYGKFSETYF